MSQPRTLEVGRHEWVLIAVISVDQARVEASLGPAEPDRSVLDQVPISVGDDIMHRTPIEALGARQAQPMRCPQCCDPLAACSVNADPSRDLEAIACIGLGQSPACLPPSAG